MLGFRNYSEFYSEKRRRSPELSNWPIRVLRDDVSVSILSFVVVTCGA
jgi:hypothetical protein